MQNFFTPKITQQTDRIADFFSLASRRLLVGLLVVLPFVFLPSTIVPTKSFFATLVVLLLVVLFSFRLLRRPIMQWSIPTPLIAWIALVGATGISALLSESLTFSLYGDALETQTVAFLALLGGVMFLMLQLTNAKRSATGVVAALVGTAVVLSVHQILRIIWPESFLGFGVLQSPSDSLIGSFNDLGYFVSLALLVILVTSVQMTLSKRMIWGLSASSVVLLLIMMVVNISYLWVILGLVSLAILLYSLSRDREAELSPAQWLSSLFAIGVAALIFVSSAIFFIAGGSVGQFVVNTTGVQYIEVKPSFTTTIDIMRQSLGDNFVTGVGPNRFGDLWLQYRDVEINQTTFWNTTFVTGNGYLTTWFATTGLLGVVAWFVFIVLFLYRGIKTLLLNNTNDTHWYYIATTSFVGAGYLWLVAFLLVPGPTILIWAAALTGLYLAAERTITRNDRVSLPPILSSSRSKIIMIGVTLVVVVSSVIAGYAVTRQYSAVYTYTNSLRNLPEADAVSVISERLAQAYVLHQSDVYLRDIVTYQSLTVSELLQVAEPDAAQQQQFNGSVATMVELATEATRIRPYNARNWQTLGEVYSFLASLDIEGSETRALEAFAEAEKRNPNNPYYSLQRALFGLRSESYDDARGHLENAIRLKSNYIDAIATLAQLELQLGRVDESIAVVQSLILLEPNNPARYYLLAVLATAKEDYDTTLAALNQAIVLNPRFANALYLRAIEQYRRGEVSAAVADLEVVKTLDQANSQVDDVIAQMQAGSFDLNATDATEQVTEPAEIQVQDDIVTTETVPDTNMLTPVNNAGNQNQTNQTDTNR